ncbi:MAG TPA: hypothetical protein VLW50_12935 [Streptosporangiaceae bacterium]|nr:hypothetical protein [Streptosporangiaceae bacterium]
MLHLLITAIPLAVGVAIALLAAWRRWAPPIGLAIAVGAGLRLCIGVIAWRDSWQPPDFMYQFTAAIHSVLHHQDPLRLPNSEWHFLQAMAYVNAGAYRLGQLTAVPWQAIGRVVPISADIVLILLVGALAGTGERRRFAAFQYALNPLAIMICAIHGQVEPVAAAFGVGALLVGMRSRPRAHATGLLLGFAIAVNSWPALLIPGIMRVLPGRRTRLTALAWACGIPLAFLVTGPVIIGYPPRFLRSDVHALLTPRGVIGDWGWTALVTGGHQEISPAWARLGIVILFAVLAVTWYLWRRAHPVDLIAALNLAFLVGSDRVSAQYLVWPVPYQIARPSRWTQPALVLCAAWAGAGYLWLSRAPTEHAWGLMHQPWALSSLVILPVLVLAMPWKRRTRRDAIPCQQATAHPGGGRVHAAAGVRGRSAPRRDDL